MLKLIIAAVNLSLFVSVAHAEPCASIEHAELKEMSAEEMKREYCKAKKVEQENAKEVMELLLSGYGARSTIDGLKADRDACTNEVDKIKRALVRKGEPEETVTPKNLCQK